MSEKYKAKVKGELYFITITIIDWVDLLTRPVYKDIIIDSLKHCQDHKKLNVHAFVIMTNHVHAILSCEEEELENIMRDMKKFTSKKLVETVNTISESRRVWMLKKFEYAARRTKNGVNHKFWKDGYHPIHLSTNKMIDQRLDYVHNNPVEEGYVFRPEDYVYSSAGIYSGENGLLALQILN